ncbi:MAG: hypothetical protein COU51_03630, partial [Parcubacteria group bacterium CG10_big_fil_rev_8_21_14_0_10_36_14]
MPRFTLSIGVLEGKKVINFANHSKEFVEVIFDIDGKDAKRGLPVSEDTKGYGYPPKLEKPVKKLKDGSPLPFNPSGGDVRAYIYTGEGGYRDEDMDYPTFMRHQLVERFKFK